MRNFLTVRMILEDQAQLIEHVLRWAQRENVRSTAPERTVAFNCLTRELETRLGHLEYHLRTASPPALATRIQYTDKEALDQFRLDFEANPEEATGGIEGRFARLYDVLEGQLKTTVSAAESSPALAILQPLLEQCDASAANLSWNLRTE